LHRFFDIYSIPSSFQQLAEAGRNLPISVVSRKEILEISSTSGRMDAMGIDECNKSTARIAYVISFAVPNPRE
jgi:hypothetical protein